MELEGNRSARDEIRVTFVQRRIIGLLGNPVVTASLAGGRRKPPLSRLTPLPALQQPLFFTIIMCTLIQIVKGCANWVWKQLFFSIVFQNNTKIIKSLQLLPVLVSCNWVSNIVQDILFFKYSNRHFETV